VSARVIEVAWAWRSGVIEFGQAEPAGAIAIGKASSTRLREAVSAVARHAYDGTTLLVPGIPEATDSNDALNALVAFTRQVNRRLRRHGGAGR